MSESLIRAAAEHERVSNAREDAAWIAAFYTGLIDAGMESDYAFEITSQWLASYVELATVVIEDEGDETAECGVDDE